MTKAKYPPIDRRSRDEAIITLRKKKYSYKQIMAELNVTHGVVLYVIKRDRCVEMSDPSVRKAFNHVLYQSKNEGMKVGKISDVCSILGYKGVKWVLKSKPDGMSFAEYVGVILKDLHLEMLDGNT